MFFNDDLVIVVSVIVAKPMVDRVTERVLRVELSFNNDFTHFACLAIIIKSVTLNSKIDQLDL